MESESVESLCQGARQAIAQGDIESARQLYLQALGLKSDAPDVHYGLATVCFLLNDLESASYHFKEVTRLDPLRPGAFINLGAVYNRLGEYDEAVTSLRRGIQLDPKRAEGYYNLGLVYRNKGQTNLAAQAYIEATRMNPRMIDAHFNLANLYLEIGRLQQAADRYKQVLQLRPSWDKAEYGLKQALEASADQNQDLEDQEAPHSSTSDTSVPSNQALDLQKTIDPNTQGMLLTHLNQATIDSENQGRQFIQNIEQEMEPAIKELSVCLLYPDGAARGLDNCLQKFENAMQILRKTQRNLQTNLERVRNLGERLLTSQGN